MRPSRKEDEHSLWEGPCKCPQQKGSATQVTGAGLWRQQAFPHLYAVAV